MYQCDRFIREMVERAISDKSSCYRRTAVHIGDCRSQKDHGICPPKSDPYQHLKRGRIQKLPYAPKCTYCLRSNGM